MRDWVGDVERAYVAAAGKTSADVVVAPGADRARAAAAAGAVASRYLAVGTPRSISLVLGSPDDIGAAVLSQQAHERWFAAREWRVAFASSADASALAADTGWRAVTLAEALAADIVCAHVPLSLAAAQLRRGTHVNALAGATLDDDLARLATVVREREGLPALAAGLVDGRQLDELTVFLLEDARIALSAL